MTRKMTPFAQKVFSIVKKIPNGKVLTYKQVAEKAGSPRAFRAVGSLMKTNFDPSIPCHRVIKSDGSLGNYNRGGTSQKRKILLAEGAKLI
ncbi:MAG: 6-O-methylguanine DNA methyltransferase [Candidatus Taylorbacteria bacterium CG11_big_fil_rev_8_21_14_0_20_46_11]|uniref:6-O-methylguanine DNA methyltransferase n=1 Tax=Candidatus Taylorbacteria bacterium CG11_big_fil_rev_8_21_14_0_20_46_11 TaxID=1975025 RepID=A0A2H0KC28_9BACT|nr:MAG: 6-O-methylguanine DNA methyltransferase [Candidatus Taylorbacteria bacterium CG11_big_fil_rev_8_21_14_0_20_46_11]